MSSIYLYNRNETKIYNTISMTSFPESNIQGTGHGSAHLWVRGETLGRDMYGNVPELEDRHTSYHCRRCGINFDHYYCVIVDIFDAMKRARVPIDCKPQDNK